MTPKLQFIKREERPIGNTVPMGISYGSYFHMRLNQARLPSFKEWDQRCREALKLAGDFPIRLTLAEVDYQILVEAIDGEDWVNWLYEQKRNGQPVSWSVWNLFGKYRGPMSMDPPETVVIIIEDEATALLFTQTFKGT